jgi:hypothetical protein
VKLFWYVWNDGSVSILPANNAIASLVVDELFAVDQAELIDERARFRRLKRAAQIEAEDASDEWTPGEAGEAAQLAFAEAGSRKPRKLQH